VEAIEGVSARKHLTVQQFMALPAVVRKSKVVGPGLLTERQYQQAGTIAQQLPYLKVEKTFFKVHSEKFVTPNSLVQFVVKARVIPPGSIKVPAIKDKDLEDVEKVDKSGKAVEDENRVAPPLAHAPFFARDHSPKWHIFLADSKQGKIAVPPFTFSTFDKPLFTEDGQPTYNVQTLKMQFGAPPQPGRYTFQMNLVCDSYLGLDTKMDVTMEVDDETKAEEMADEGEISEPDEGKFCPPSVLHKQALTRCTDSLAGQMRALRGGAVKKAAESDDDSGSNTEGEEAGDDDTSETDTDTDTDGE
jgi:translocation protein SEC63